MGRRVVGRIGIGIGALAGAVVLTAGVFSVLVARTVLIPPSRRAEDVEIVALDSEAKSIKLSSNADSRLPGIYSFWFSGDSGHARLGEITESDGTTITRRLLGVDFGDLKSARHGRLSGWFHLSPRDLGHPYRNVTIETPLGQAPAWLVPARADGASKRWVINVHGRAVRRSETLRAVEPFRDAGYDSLIVSYRNDGEAPRSADHRYSLGDREWRDIEPAMQFALDNGAEEIVLMGWSMGGATVLQALTRSPLAERVTGVVLESPVVDWIATLDFQTAIRGLPAIVRWGVLELFSRPWGRIFTGLAEPIDLDRLDFVRRARELDRPILILHSDDDGFVPSTASRALAVARPDIVTYEAFRVARHTKLWNYDRERWVGAIRDWLKRLD